ncbi:hypothetical protein BLD25_03980 [Candidatus Gracilibacteria bacterium GN02-872]|nr:hypothetical protein BLD25_03980 [Candidatus Gracilibacteria bacterium GN02-872]
MKKIIFVVLSIFLLNSCETKNNTNISKDNTSTGLISNENIENLKKDDLEKGKKLINKIITQMGDTTLPENQREILIDFSEPVYLRLHDDGSFSELVYDEKTDTVIPTKSRKSINKMQKLDKILYPILSENEAVCKAGEKKMTVEGGYYTACLADYYEGCGDGMGCGGNKDDNGENSTQYFIPEVNLVDNRLNNYIGPSWHGSFNDEKNRLVINKIAKNPFGNQDNYYGKLYYFKNIIFLDFYDKDFKYLYTEVFMFNGKKSIGFRYNKYLKDHRRFLETVHMK